MPPCEAEFTSALTIGLLFSIPLAMLMLTMIRLVRPKPLPRVRVVNVRVEEVFLGGEAWVERVTDAIEGKG